MRPFLVCIHDATPAFARETATIVNDLAPLLGRRLSFGVVPNWHNAWPLAAHSDYCAFVNENSEELLLHGYVHHRQQGFGPVTWLAESSDEMNGLGLAETMRTLERAQCVFSDAFGARARGFLAPAWQQGHALRSSMAALDLQYLLGFFSIESDSAQHIPLATFTWDCGRWSALGHIGHGIGSLLHNLRHGVPTLAIHPRDVQRGFWPQITRLTQELLDTGHEPTTPSSLLEASHAEVTV